MSVDDKTAAEAALHMERPGAFAASSTFVETPADPTPGDEKANK